MKGCNCSGGCKHFKVREKTEQYLEKDSNGKILVEGNLFIGYEHYCDVYPERYKKFYEENGSKPSLWVRENVNMDCYEPDEVQETLDNMLDLLNKIKESLENKN